MNVAAPVLSDMGRAALDLVRLGVPVFPCGPDKVPLTAHGFKDASRDEATVERMWAAHPGALIGVPTGGASGIYVVDCDVDKDTGETLGEHTLCRLGFGDLFPVTPGCITQSGGLHLYFRHPGAGYGNTAKRIAPGVDTRGDGGYVIVPPSRTAGGQYRSRGTLDPKNLPELPEGLRKLLTGPAAPKIDTGPNGTDKWADAALRNELAGLLAAPEGQRNHALNKAAFALGQIVAGGGLSEALVRDRLTAAAQGIGLDARETAATINSGLGKGMTEPRGPKEKESRQARRQNERRAVKEREAGPAGIDGVDLTEDGVALAFTERFGGKLRFDHDAGAWFEWMGDHWKQDGTGLAFNWCREMARGASAGEDDKGRATARKKSFAAGVEAFARSDRSHAVRQDVWDTDPFRLGVPGGVVDLRTGQLSAPDADQGITKLAAVAPADRADCPLWLAFLLEACGGDADMVAFLKRWCGYCLTGDTREHALIFLYGPGGNGKSVFLNTVARIMADYATTAAMDTFTTSKGDKHPTELALLRGSRMVSASETEEGRAWAEAKIKQMTGGDPITARFMRQDFFTYRPAFKLTIVSNHAPALANVDDAARRRFNIVPFVHKPAAPDRQLEEKLMAEWPAILRWMIDGTGEWLRDGLQQPESVRAATADYFSEQDMVAHWLAECCTIAPGNSRYFETTNDLFKSWSDFAKAAGETVGTQKAMAPRLRRHGLRQVARWVQGKTARVWEGVEILKPQGGDDV